MRDSPAAFEGKTMPLVVRLARLGRRALEAASFDLSQRQLLVLTLVNERKQIGQQGLGEAIGMDASNLVGLLNELESAELVVRRRDLSDRRRHLIELTAEGERTVKAAHMQLGAIEDQLFAVLDLSERQILQEFLSRIVDAAERTAEAARPSRG